MKKTATVFLIFFLWSSSGAFAQESPKILIAYFSKSGSTAALAESIAKGAESVSGVEVWLRSIDQIQTNEILEASAIILGSPVYNANPAPEVLEFINSWPFENRPLKDKIGAAFATGGGISIGEEEVMMSIMRSMLIHGMILVGGENVEASFGASGITGEGPFSKEKMDPLFLDKGLGLGKRVAEWAKKSKGI
ncbi:flavodoxin family protein [Algoriphagus mannitolivorans]|uniref:flavodoxin family protein n=1 Tax=Algoriphagus mannitolivorans TaxID=226504 RepID=UPI00041CEA75|nr:flavodoxin family protein [Algoriphagus mannitolivorans]